MKSYPTTLTAKETYDMIKAPDIGKLSDQVGQVLGLTGYILHEELDQAGEIVEVLNIRDEDDKVYATNSKVFIREFKQVLEIVGDDASQIKHIEVLQGRTNGGRNYITMKWVD